MKRQIAQNKVLRMMDNCRIRDRKSITEMLVKNEILSVNQVAAQIKLTEAWKSINDEKLPNRYEEKMGWSTGGMKRNKTRGQSYKQFKP